MISDRAKSNLLPFMALLPYPTPAIPATTDNQGYAQPPTRTPVVTGPAVHVTNGLATIPRQDMCDVFGCSTLFHNFRRLQIEKIETTVCFHSLSTPKARPAENEK
ncbi:hypothetical protein Vi05172_g1378 [Venturia inaequalis]|nr:hypothetical protein Vi05172_g1378 [Venturia inaequalis]